MSNTPHKDNQKQNCTITHPFHPLFGSEIEIVTIRHNWKEHRVYFHDQKRRLQRVSFSWTSLYTPPPAITVAHKKSPFLLVDLLELVQMIQDILAKETK